MGSIIQYFVARYVTGPSPTTSAIASRTATVIQRIPYIGGMTPVFPEPYMTNRFAVMLIEPATGAAGWVLWAVVGFISIVALLYQVAGCCGLTGTRLGAGAEAVTAGALDRGFWCWPGYRGFAARRQAAVDRDNPSKIPGRTNLRGLVEYAAWDAFSIPLEFLALFVQGTFKAFGLVMGALPILFVLLFLLYVTIPIQAYPYSAFDAVDGANALAVTSWNAGFGLINTLGDAGFSAFCMPFNLMVKTGVQFIQITVEALALSGTGALTGNAGTDVLAQVNDVGSFSDFGRRRLVGAEAAAAHSAHRRRAGEAAGNQYSGWLVIEQYSVLISQTFDLVLNFLLLLYKLVLAIIAPVIADFMQELAAVIQPIMCAIQEIPCAALELFSQAVQELAVLINIFIGILLNPFLALFPGKTQIAAWKPAAFGCSKSALQGVACNCAVFFSNVPPCDAPSYSCAVDPNTGLWTMYTTQGSLVTHGIESQDAAVACGRTRRMLTAFGHVINTIQDGGGLSCHYACVDGLAIEACPPGEDGMHVLLYRGACAADDPASAERRAARRRLGAAESPAADSAAFERVERRLRSLFGVSAETPLYLRDAASEHEDDHYPDHVHPHMRAVVSGRRASRSWSAPTRCSPAGRRRSARRRRARPAPPGAARSSAATPSWRRTSAPTSRARAGPPPRSRKPFRRATTASGA